MAIKVSISSWSYRTWFDAGKIDLLGFVDEVKRQGADGLEIFPRHIDAADPAGCLKKVADKARQAGLSIASVIATNDFARPTAAERAEQVERLKTWLAYTAEAGIERMNVFTGYHVPGQDPMMEVYRVIDGYREVAPVAEAKGVVMCLENHSSVATDADSLLRILQAVGSDNLRTNPDFSNFVPEFAVRSDKARQAIYDQSARFVPLAANAHLKVGDFADDGEHAFLDVGRLMGMLKDAKYDGHLVLEVYGQNEPVETCKKGIALVRRHI